MTRIDEHIARLKGRCYDWPIPWEDVESLARDEDCRTTPYRCIAGQWTCGWGETEGITPDMRWTLSQCDARLLQQVARYARKVEAMLDVPANPNQLGALVRLAYNIGLSALARSTVLRRHNEGDFQSAARAFALWNKFTDPSTGQLAVSNGLTARRARETARYLASAEDTPAERMPQAVAPESDLAASPIARGGAITAGTGIVATASALAEEAKGASDVAAKFHDIAKQVADWVGLPPLVLFGAVLVIVGVIVIRQRANQRAKGWA